MKLSAVIRRPLVTEKTTVVREIGPTLVFEVARDATKPQIRSAIEQLFGVKVTGVWTSNVRGKEKRMGKTVGHRPNWKKAIVTLRDGDTIEIFEG